MRVKYEAKDPKRAALCGTLEGFFEELPTCQTQHGVRALLRKHFSVISENKYVLTVQVDGNSSIYLSEIQTEQKRKVGKNGGRTKNELNIRYECHFQRKDMDVLVWYQERPDGQYANAPVCVLSYLDISGILKQHAVIDAFRARTDQFFQKICGLEASEIEALAREVIEKRLDENGVVAKIKEVVVAGSRCRGLENNLSDLDIVVELETEEREDDLFNILNAYPYCIADVAVDINPITAQRTGTMETYLLQAEEYLKSRMQQEAV